MLVPAANLLMAVLSNIAGPFIGIPAPDQPVAAGASSTASQVTITVADGAQRVNDGQMVRYQVVVRNGGDAETPLTVKLVVSPDTVTGLQADGAAVVANAVAWKNIVGPGETRTYAVAGRVEPRGQTREFSVTACVHQRLDEPAVACATDLNALAGEQDKPARMAWLASILFGILAVAGALWLHKKVNPEPLTPANARDTLPGGAPSA